MKSFSALMVLSVLALAAQGCTRRAAGTEPASADAIGDDGSRCEYAGHKDLETLETRSAAARSPNVRRVYKIGSNKRDPQRVLVCREVDTNLDGRKDVFRELDNRGQPTRESADTDYDGRLDTWLYFTGGRLRKLELDRGGDGQVDETRFYNQGLLSKIQRDTNRDGKPDRWEAYDKGKLNRIGVDKDFDGVVDRWLQGAASDEAANSQSASNQSTAKSQ